MRFLIPGILILSFPFLLCGQQTLQGSITHDNLKRDYILYVPASYSPGTPVPVVLNFHGYTSNAAEQLLYGDFRSIADTAGFLVVHPQGTDDLIGNPHWNVGWGTSTVDDVGFTRALIDSLSAAYTIDADRIYSTGMSNGGFFSYRLACDLSDRIAAIASVTGSMNNNQFASCHPVHPMPVMEVHGTADPVVAYDGNILFASIPTVVSFWTDFNACLPTPVITDIPDIQTDDGCTAQRLYYPDGMLGSTVEHYKIIGGEHTWPGSAFGGAGTNQDFNASKEIWRFFSQYDIHGRIGITANTTVEVPLTFSVYPNPAQHAITIEWPAVDPVPFALSNLIGQTVMHGNLSSGSTALDLTSCPPGIYVLQVGRQSRKIALFH